MKTKDNTYDAIVIGSGIGGLTTAALLSKIYKKRVLVLEQHFVIGGQTHEFRRKGFHWDVGVHYVGGMKKGYLPRQLFDFITNGKLEWQKMPHEFEHFVYPDFTFIQPADKYEFKAKLIAQFPDEIQAINQYFIDLSKVNKWYVKNMAESIMPSVLKSITQSFGKSDRQLALSSTKEYLDTNFNSKELKALLTSIWGDYGVPPSQSAFVMHALVANSFLYGGYYPIGGASQIAKNIIPVIEENGGKVLGNRLVNDLIIENNTVKGVKAAHHEETESWFAKTVISNIGALNTFKNLVPENTATSVLSDLKKLGEGYGTVTLYLGLDDSPEEELGIKGENYWIFNNYDHDRVVHEEIHLDDLQFDFAFVSFPSLKNPIAESHTAEIMTTIPYHIFEKWKDQKWLKRDTDYYDLKEMIGDALLDYVEAKIPGLSKLVVHHEISTPLTMEYFTKWEKGAFYGLPATPERFECKHLTPKTPIKNLWLTGTDVATLGIMGAAMGGVKTVAAINGSISFLKIMNTIKNTK